MALENRATVTAVKSFLVQCPGTRLCSFNLFAGQKIILLFLDSTRQRVTSLRK